MGVYAGFAQIPDIDGVPLARAVAKLVPRRLLRRWAAPRVRTSVTAWDGSMPFIAGAAAARSRPTGSPTRIIHVIGTLGPGGAERQLCNLAIEQHHRGYDVLVMVLWHPEGEHGHYLPLLQEAGVPVDVAGRQFDDRFVPALRSFGRGGLELPQECWPFAVDLFGEFVSRQPDLVHAWLDSPNISAGIGAVLAGTPRIVLSTRNVNPTHFPNLSRGYYRRAYQALVSLPGVVVVNNSHNGADDYCQWLGIDRSRIHVVLNGLDLSRMTPSSPADAAALRASLGIDPHAPVIAGVFRLAEEKQPLVFLDVIERVVRRVPTAVAVFAGIGPLEDDLRGEIDRRGLQRHAILAGRLSDVRPLYSAATLTLLCSRQEGTPNVLLESQWFGCPVVSTRAGGAVDAVADGRTGYLRDVGDVEGLVQATLCLLEDPAKRDRLAQHGPTWIREQFSVERMVDNTLEAYGRVS